MLTKKEKALLEESIYNLIKESIFEDGFDENYYFEDDDEGEDEDWNEEDDDENDGLDDESEYDDDDGTPYDKKREIVHKWLSSAQELHSVLSYRLYPKLTKGGARSKFSKKFRGEDHDGKPYEFNEIEINRLYNMKDDYIEKIKG